MYLLVLALPGPTLRLVESWLEDAGWNLAPEAECLALYPGDERLPTVLRALPAMDREAPVWAATEARSAGRRVSRSSCRTAWQRLIGASPDLAVTAPGLVFALDGLEADGAECMALAVVESPLDSAGVLIREHGLALPTALALWEAHVAAVFEAERHLPVHCLRLSGADAPAVWIKAFSAAASAIASAGVAAASAGPVVAGPPLEAAILDCLSSLREAAPASRPGLPAREQVELWEIWNSREHASPASTISLASLELLRQARQICLLRGEVEELQRALCQTRREAAGYADNARLQARTVEQANRALELLYASSTWRLGRLLVEPLRRFGQRPPVWPRSFGQPICPWVGLDAADYERWSARYSSLSAHDRIAISRHIETFTFLPRFSILIDADAVGDASVMQEMIAAALAQLYPAWELCVAVAGNPSEELLRLAAGDERVRIEAVEPGACLLQAACDAGRGEWLLPLQRGTLLVEHALYLLAWALENEPDLDVLYGDEDELDRADRRRNPWFKPAWNPDSFHSRDCLHALALRRRCVEQVGGFRDRFAPAQVRDLVLRLLESEPSPRVHHLPFILMHRRVADAADQAFALRLAEAGRAALEDHFLRARIEAQVLPARNPLLTRVRYPLPSTLPLISLVVPSQCRSRDLERCREMLEKTAYPNIEYLLVANNLARGSARHLRRFAQDARVRVLHDSRPFNFSDHCNMGAAQARGEFIGLLNDDLVPLDPGWLEEMLRQALRPEVGVVGAMLCYPGASIQHAGVVLGMGIGAGHAWKGLPRDSEVNGGTLAHVQECSAVTAACMLMRRQVYDTAGGFDPAWRVAFNDVDFCLRVRQAGYRILWTPYAALLHLESLSRGDDDSTQKQARLKREIDLLQERWGEALRDPFYNPNLSLTGEHYAFAFPPRQRSPWQPFPPVMARVEEPCRLAEDEAGMQDIPIAGWIAADADIIDVGSDDGFVYDLALLDRFDLLHNAPYRYVKAFRGRMRPQSAGQRAPRLLFSLADGGRYTLAVAKE